MKSRIARLDLALDRLGEPQGRDRLDVQPLVRLEQLERLERQPSPGPRPGRDSGRTATPPSGGTQRNVSVASSIRSHSTHRSTSGRWPSSSARCISYQRATRPGAMPGVEQLVGAAQEGVQRLRRVALLELRSASSARYQAVAALSRRSRSRSQAWPTWTSVTTSNVRPARERHAQLRERLEAMPPRRDVGRRIPFAIALSLPSYGRDQRQDAVRLAQVEPREHDRIGDVSAGHGHGPTVPPRVAIRREAATASPRPAATPARCRRP